MGELTASVAHELNQPLGAILSNAEAAELLLAADPPALGEVRAIVADIIRDDRRAGEVIRRMRGFLRKSELESEPQDLNALIGNVARLLAPEAHMRRVAVSLDLDPHLPPVRGDLVHLQQVVLNLMLNGMEAMGQVPPAERSLVVRTERAGAQTAEVAVEDRGAGIQADRLPRIFDPFYTTKPGGMGMGLSIVRSIVEAHGGRVWAENNPQRGATVRFTIPLGAIEPP
jgi:two-component system sensor kinase FixL